MEYLWDDNGNLLNDGVNTYTYDHANRLKIVSSPTISATYAYTGLGDRVQQTVNGVPETYLLDMAGGLTQVLDDGTNTYLYGVGRISQQGITVTEYFLGDALGSVRQLADEDGEVTLAKSYKPYGEELYSGGDGESSYGFTNEWTDATGLVYLRSRYYAPAQSRFITGDIWEGDYTRSLSLNRWIYVEANPVNYYDPTGNGRRPYNPYGSGIGGGWKQIAKGVWTFVYADPFGYSSLSGSSSSDKKISKNKNFNEKISPSGINFVPGGRRILANIIGSDGKVVPPGTNQSQFKIKGYTSHTQLCGAVAIAALLTLTYPHITAHEVVETAMDSVGADNMGTGDIGLVFNTYYKDYWKASTDYIVTKWIPKKEEEGTWYWQLPENRSYWNIQIENWISSTYFVFSLVKANGNEGRLYDSNNGVNHWVVITGVSKPFVDVPWNSDKNWVRIYNPFDNETEYYPWEYFRTSWEWGGNFMVLARKISGPYLKRDCGQ